MLAAPLAALLVAGPAAAQTVLGGYHTTSPTGAETMVGVPYSLPGQAPCAHYTNYNATVDFAAQGLNVAAQGWVAYITSNPGQTIWDEGPEGTHYPPTVAPPPLPAPVPSPPGGPTADACGANDTATANTPTAVPGFSFILVNTATGNQVTCIGTATYLRDTQPGAPAGVTGQDITVTGCGYTLEYSIDNSLPPLPPFFSTALCDSPIAPSACVISNRGY